MTTDVLDLTSGPSADRPGAGPGRARWEPAPPPPQVEAAGVRAGWQCLVGGDRGSVAAWLHAKVGPAGSVFVTDLGAGAGGGHVPDPEALHQPPSHPAFRGWFDLVYARLDAFHPLDRTRALERLLDCLRPGGWIVVEDRVALPFRLPAGDVPGAAGPGVTAAIRAAADDSCVDLEWARRVPGLLRSGGCSDVRSEALCAVWPGGSARIALPDTDGDGDGDPPDRGGAGAGTGAASGAGSGSGHDLPVALAAFRWLLLDPFRGRSVGPALATDASVVFSTCGRRR